MVDNQHRKITGYRDLSQTEIDLMNDIKALGVQLASVHMRVRAHLHSQERARSALPAGDAQDVELERILDAEPQRWAAIGKTHLQEGLMALTRAVAQPGSF